MQKSKAWIVSVLCSSLSACGGCSEPKHIPPAAQPVFRDVAKSQPVRRAAVAVQSGVHDVQGALISLVDRALTGLDTVTGQLEALEVDYAEFKAGVGKEFESLWGKVNQIDRTLTEFIPAVDQRFNSVEARVERLEQVGGFTYAEEVE